MAQSLARKEQRRLRNNGFYNWFTLSTACVFLVFWLIDLMSSIISATGIIYRKIQLLEYRYYMQIRFRKSGSMILINRYEYQNL